MFTKRILNTKLHFKAVSSLATNILKFSKQTNKIYLVTQTGGAKYKK